MKDLLQDIRYGCRVLLNNPGFTLVAVVSLAFGIGFNTTIFSAVDAVLLKPKIGWEPDRLVDVYLSDASGYPYGLSSYPDYESYRDRNDVFSAVAAFQPTVALYRSGDSREYLLGEVATGNFFELVGIPMTLGRALQASDDVSPGGHPVVVVGETFWRSRLGADPNAVGQSLDLNGRPFTIIGVTSLNSSLPGFTSAFWAPAAMIDHLNPSRDETSRLERATSRSWFVKARLERSVDIARARSAMDALALSLREESPEVYGDRGIQLLASTDVRLHPVIDDALSPVAIVMMAIVALVLLIACANVANMALARASSRRTEVAIRLALGSSRWRLARQLLTESILLSAIGGALGLLIAFWSTQAILAFKPPLPFPIALDLTLDLRILAFTFIVSFATGIVFGLAPALQASRQQLVPALKSGSSSSSGRKFLQKLSLGNALVVVQVAVSLVLLIGASLLLRSAGNAHSIDPGFETRDAVMLSAHLGLHGYDEETARVFHRRAIEQVTSLPEVDAAALAMVMPLGMNVSTRMVAPEGREPEKLADWREADASTVSPRYFETLGIPFIQGRDFSDRDVEGAPHVVIVNETFAREFWPGENPIGKRLARRRADVSSRDLHEVIGVVRDNKVRTLGEDPRAQVFFSTDQEYTPTAFLVARTRGNPEVALGAVRRELLALDSRLAFFDAKTMEQNLAATLFPVRAGATLLGIFGALALVLASIGLYGVVAYSVSGRTREIGIRMALGAARADVVSMVTKQGLALVAAGCVLGLAGSAIGTRVLASVLYGIDALDITTFTGATLLLVGVALCANLIPARRASRIEPVTALHYE